ncbi:LptF/LptG family permease [Hirschia baltica]|uniref:Permease YjgP/YjgQ family protein n=1 Tax=Hirschia baltica (strain ATCC 49814 / DSM 5838 / IFAM 1418) TaxID=582402 RepID=C6XKP5_HIRBI|nr:LptF/LptG family permease [Hirschia baltica]ACT59612.1 permease YjgP/YjgQ family protein [Hirschia baltica ATCC 49814]
MDRFQQYLFGNVLRTMVSIVGGLVLIALLTQGLTQIDLIVENRQSAFTFLYVSMLAAPQVIGLLLPIALFVAAIATLNRAHRDSEIVVAQAAGMSRLQIASPVLRIAAIAALLHLCINLWVQPASYREMRETLTSARTDLAATLVKPGEFNSPAHNLTVYIGKSLGGGELRTLLISDARDPDANTTYIARTGAVTEVEGVPAILMRNARVQKIDGNGQLWDGTFDQYIYELAAFVDSDTSYVLKASDRFLHELLYPDFNNFYDRDNAEKFYAEGHSRLALPLMNMFMAMLAVVAVLGGDFSRRGYQTRISVATGIGLFAQLLALASVSVGEDNPKLNFIQYLIPILSFTILAFMFFWGRSLKLAAHAMKKEVIKQTDCDNSGAAA